MSRGHSRLHSSALEPPASRMIVRSWIELLQSCPTLVLPKGLTIYHGARRLLDEPLVQDVMWLALDRRQALNYLDRDADIAGLRRELLAFEVIRDLQLLDCSKLDGPDLSSKAQSEHTTARVGAFDLPLRRHLIFNARAVHGGHLDGCMQVDQQILLDQVLEKTRLL